MVRPGARRCDDDLGDVTDRASRVEGRAVTASSRGVRGRHSISDIPSTSTPIAPGMYYDPGAPGSSTQPPIPFRIHPPTTSYHLYTPVPRAEYEATARGNSSSDIGLGRDSGTSRSEEAVRVGSLCMHSSEGNEDEREDDGGHDDDDDDGDNDGDDHEPVPVVEASSSGHRPALD
ncbi:hypothetical protein M9H77_11609 [Catharanthus roseus]|uniref:Uncharacterized protein n=1 Tax=Catharanthus roseus TaxID=4058 RepID=A0ACC0BF42_CATRO|nr:hypothetical protein M9H77_11609 [Catharanthus roseus]